MREKYTISRDDSIYEAWPDLALTQSGRLVCVFSECTHHGDRSYSRIAYTVSDDRGRHWSPKGYLSPPAIKQSRDDAHWNCPRITSLPNGRLVVIVDRVGGPNEGNSPNSIQENVLFFSNDDGNSWSAPQPTPIVGIVPDKIVVLNTGVHAGRWLASAHRFHKNGTAEQWEQRLWYSDDSGQSWSAPVTIAQSDTLKLCEGNILELPSGALVCFLRENSFSGKDAYKSISLDQGKTWGSHHPFPSPGLHRPTTGLLQSGRVLITHRYLPGGKGGWGNMTQNTFATLTDVDSCLAYEREQIATRVFPLDYDRHPLADTGYTGWVQFADGGIYIVNYILDDAPKAHIRGYSLSEADILLSQGHFD